MKKMNTLYFITGNQGKVKEAKEKFTIIDLELIKKNIGYPEIQTETLEEVVQYGVKDIIERMPNQAFILEDAGIFIDSLKGFPGVYSSYIYHTIGLEGILTLMSDKRDRKATFKSVYGYVTKEGTTTMFIGECEGQITNEMIGNKGFGYDPIFIPKGSEKTFAEMDIEEKNNYSHRGKSLNKLIKYIKNIDKK